MLLTPSYSFLLDPTSSISDALLPRFLLEVFIVIILTRSLGAVLKYVKQPPVIGEIIGGILLGPSVLGQIPGWTNNIFPAQSVTIFGIIANFGLIFFMFYLGLEMDMNLIRSHWRTSVPIAISAIVFPFGIGTLTSLFLQDVNRMIVYTTGPDDTQIIDPVNTYDPSTTAFVLFAGTAMSFTAFPVLASILTATKLMNSDLGIQALSCAAVDDVMAWCVLAIASSFAKTGDPMNGVYTALLAIAFILFWVFPVRICIHKLYDYVLTKQQEQVNHGTQAVDMDRTFIIVLCLMLLTGAFVAEIIGIHAFFGAFVCGIIVPKYGPLQGWLAPKIELLTVEFLLPLYFATSGLRTNIGTISSAYYGGITVAVVIIACVAKWLPSTLMTRWATNRDWKFCSTVGILMNTRGLVELIALNIGLSMKILSPRLFTIMVIMALVTTFATSPLLYWLYQKDNPEMQMRELVQEATTGNGNGNGYGNGAGAGAARAGAVTATGTGSEAAVLRDAIQLKQNNITIHMPQKISSSNITSESDHEVVLHVRPGIDDGVAPSARFSLSRAGSQSHSRMFFHHDIGGGFSQTPQLQQQQPEA